MEIMLKEIELLKRSYVYLSTFITVISLCITVVSSGQDVNDLKLKDYRPVSIYKVPVTNVIKARYPAIDMHTHVYGRNDQAIARWVETMDACGIEKSIILTGASGARFDSIVSMYSKYGNRFER